MKVQWEIENDAFSLKAHDRGGFYDVKLQIFCPAMENTAPLHAQAAFWTKLVSFLSDLDPEGAAKISKVVDGGSAQ